MMKIVPNIVCKLRAIAAGPHSRRVSLLAIGLIVGALLTACGASPAPQDQSAGAQAASQATAANQNEPAATEEAEEEPGATEEAEEEPAATEEAEEDAAATEEPEAEPASTEEAEEEGEDEEAANQGGEEALAGSEEFGLTEEELIQKVEAVEALIAPCMSEAGFEYVPVDYATVRAAMSADKSAPGLSTEEYAATFGYGITTQPAAGGANNPAIIGLGEQNMQIFNSLSEADQDAYNHTLFGENPDATFAVSLEAEDFSETGGCTRTAIEQVFSPEELSATYYNPGDARLEQDPRVIAAIAEWAGCMREAGFAYDNPEQIEPDLENRLDAILDGAEPAELPAAAQAALTELQGEETAIAVADLQCEQKFIEPAIRQVETELYGAPQP